MRKPIWDDPRTHATQTLAYRGLAIKTIARLVGLTRWQVVYRLHKLGISTSDWRTGESEESRQFVLKTLKRFRLTYRYH